MIYGPRAAARSLAPGTEPALSPMSFRSVLSLSVEPYDDRTVPQNEDGSFVRRYSIVAAGQSGFVVLPEADFATAAEADEYVRTDPDGYLS